MDDQAGPPSQESDESFEEMIQHLDKAKQIDHESSQRAQRDSSKTPLQTKMSQRSDVAVLASNHEARLDEIATNDAVTHRSGKRWKSAKVGVEAHGRLPVYYRLNGLVTHKGYISQIVLDPDENTVEAKDLVTHIADADDYADYNELLDTTTFVVTGGEQLDDPFPQSELQKLSGTGTIEENYSRQPAYVIQRPGDFPNFG